jgi:hypothetical protein
LAACGGDASTELTDEQIDAAYLNAVNNNGWTDVAPEVWGDLAVEACDRAAWDHGINATLASEFLSGNGWTDRAGADQLPGIIWLNLNIACADLIPGGATPPPGSMGASGG